MLKSIAEYHEMLKLDSSRNGFAARQLLFESLTGSSVRDSNLISELSGTIRVRKTTLLTSAKSRSKMDNDHHQLVPFVSRIQRKSPEGQNVISIEWKMKAVMFFELDAVSDVLKGHNNVHKVCCTI